MSQTATATGVGVRALRAPAPAAPALRVVPVLEPRRSRLGLVVACLGMLVAGLIVLLQVNISLGHGSYEMYRLQARQDALAEQQQALEESLTAAQAPAALAAQAARLGMVPAPDPQFLRLSARDGVAPAPSGKAAPSLDR
ncbi:MAG: hypothetical protein U0Q15_13050 [Kineosporiaceae bacterium]